MSCDSGNVLCHCRNLTENKVLLGCEDGTIVLYDEDKKVTQMTSAAVVSANTYALYTGYSWYCIAPRHCPIRGAPEIN